MPTQPLVIAIDGPAGSGKSTVARKVAARVALHYVDSGASYRAVALKVLRAGLPDQQEDSIVALVEKLQSPGGKETACGPAAEIGSPRGGRNGRP